jgi:hypothetical protein
MIGLEWWTIGGLIAFGFLLWLKSNRRLPERTEPLPPDDTNGSTPTPPVKTAEKVLIEEIKKFRATMRGVATEMKVEDEAAVADDKQKIAKATEFARQTGVDKALCVILGEIWHYPTWSQREDFGEHSKIDLNDISGNVTKTERGDVKLINFGYNEQKFSIVLEHGYYHDGSPRGHITLTVSERPVFSMSVVQSDGAEYYAWNPGEIDRLEIGPWVPQIVEMEEKIEVAREKWYRDLHINLIKDQAAKL